MARPGPISVLGENLSRAGRRRVLEQLGEHMVKVTLQAFDDQARDGKEWKPRSKINRIGILLDVKNGDRIKPKRFEPRPVGIDSGRMKREVFYEIRGGGLVYGSRAPYSTDFQTGGTFSISITDDMKATLRRSAAQRSGKQKSALLALARLDEFTTTVPGRLLVKFTRKDRTVANRLVREEVKRSLRG